MTKKIFLAAMVFLACEKLPQDCGDKFIDSDTQFCVNNQAFERCWGKEFDPLTEFCYENVVHSKCNGQTYTPPNSPCVASSNSGSSSSAFVPSSSSALMSSSTVRSSSSAVPSSSSLTQCTANSNNSTHYCSEGTMKEYGLLTDDRSEPPQTYKTVVIGTQTWMAENLNFNTTGSRCYDDNTGGDSQGNCVKYGRLYNWATAMDFDEVCNAKETGTFDCPETIGSPYHQGVCPSGWHLPSEAEWGALIQFIAPSCTATTATSDCDKAHLLKSTKNWHSNNGTNEFGFSALPGGRGNSDGSFGSTGPGLSQNIGYSSIWWGATENSSNTAYELNVHNNSVFVEWGNSRKDYLFSVRCLQN